MLDRRKPLSDSVKVFNARNYFRKLLIRTRTSEVRKASQHKRDAAECSNEYPIVEWPPASKHVESPFFRQRAFHRFGRNVFRRFDMTEQIRSPVVSGVVRSAITLLFHLRHSFCRWFLCTLSSFRK